MAEGEERQREARETYMELRQRYGAELEERERRCRKYSYARLAVFLLLAALLAWHFLGGADADRLPAVLLTALALGAVFAFLVRRHGREIRLRDRAQAHVQVQEESLARLDRSWDGLPLRPLDLPADAAALGRDLGLRGRASLGHLLSNVATPDGRRILGRWLVSPALPEEVRRRQETVAELAPRLDLRQGLEVLARGLGDAPPELGPFLAWAEEGGPDLPGRQTVVLARVLAAAVAACVAGLFFGLSWRWLGGVLIFNFGFSYFQAKQIHPFFARLSFREGPFQRYAGLLTFLAGQEASSAGLQGLLSRLEAEDRPAHREMEKLHRLMDLSDLRLSSLHPVVQVITLWDFHVLDRLRAWRHRAGHRVREWLETVGQVEVLAAFGGLRYDHPSWAFPEILPEEPAFSAKGLAHPLLPPSRKANDVEIGPPGTFLLVTGSNMSGKSTLLRSVGVNAVLAQAGAPVCARALRMPPLKVATSILVEDSLVDGASFFWAELQRLKAVVVGAEAARAEGWAFLYLLDEILRGTNSAERRLAVEKVLGHLVEEGAIGAISTHDLELARLESLAPAARPVYFRETLHPGGDPVMTFDYQLRSGVAPTSNALELLALVGLDPDRPG